MALFLFDDDVRNRLLPFTHTRAIADIRCGILTMRERWSLLFQEQVSVKTIDALQPLYPPPAEGGIGINASIIGDAMLAAAVLRMNAGEKLVSADGATLACNGALTEIDCLKPVSYAAPVLRLQRVWDVFSLNEAAISNDVLLITEGRESAVLPQHVMTAGAENIFVEEGAKIGLGVMINATSGPVYVGRNAEIMEGCMLRGPVALCDSAVLKMGAKVYGGTTIGPGCKVGGEVSNVVFFANSNKGHDGFLGNSVIGEWCNLGADTNSSNLKNNYDEVKIWDEHQNKSVRTGLTFCGLLMGDHSKCGINTMFNTGTVVGVSCNIYGGSFPEKFIPSFTWGGSEGLVTYKFDKAMATAARMMARRNVLLSEAATNAYQSVFDQTTEQRRIFAQDPTGN